MKTFKVFCAVLAAGICYSQGNFSITNGLATSGGIKIGSTGGPPFTVLSLSQALFLPSHANLAIPQYTINGVLFDQTGYQDGAVINGQWLYLPYQIGPGGTTFNGAQDAGWPHGVLLSYDLSKGFAGFTNAANWKIFDMNTLSWFSKGSTQGCVAGCVTSFTQYCATNPSGVPAGTYYEGPGPGQIQTPTCQALIGGEVGATVVGQDLYMTPGERTPYQALVVYHGAIGPITNPAAYEVFVPPKENTTMGKPYGWTGGCADNQYVYYPPLADHIFGVSGNIFRYDTTKPFGNPAGGLTASWSAFNMKISAISTSAAGFFGCAYDGHRYVYYLPYKLNILIRYDTWNGGTSPDGSGFATNANYKAISLLTLGTGGNPPTTGFGSLSSLTQAFAGGRVVWNTAGTVEYLYLVPYAFISGLNPVNSGLAARVTVGTNTGTWAPCDISGNSCNWEIFDTATLSFNSAWPVGWPTTFTSSSAGLAGTPTMGGWQLTWLNATTNAVGFITHSGNFLFEHNVNKHLYDSSGWSGGGPRFPTCKPSSGFGGPYDPVNHLLGPSTAGVPLCMWSGSGL